MGQIAYFGSTGEIVEAFSASDAEWEAICTTPKGQLLMPRSKWPAVAKTSIRGLRFFSHHSGYPGKLPAPESYVHTRLKIEVARTLRELGYAASVEVPGNTPGGEEWVADVLAINSDGNKVAFEIQFSSQHLSDFRARTDRYTESGVRVCWLMPEKPVVWRITKALAYENMDYYKVHKTFISDCEKIIPFALSIKGKNDYPDPLPPIRFGRGQHMKRLTLVDALQGMMIGRPKWEMPDWKWEVSDTLNT